MSKGIPCSYPHPGLAIRGVNFSQGPEQDKPLAGRFAGPKKIRGFSESAELTKVAVKGTGPIRVLKWKRKPDREEPGGMFFRKAAFLPSKNAI